jgi:hypothetical protein
MSFLWDMWENKGEVLGGLLGTAKEPTGSTLGGIWDFLTTVDPERRASIEANQEALKQRRLTPDEWGNTPNAWLYNSEFSDDPNKPSRFFKNIVPNAARFYTETSDMLQIPQDVIEPVGNLVAGGILNLSPLSGLLSEDVGLEQREMASQFGNVVVDTFKSWDNFTDAIANNPLDAMGILMGAGYSGVKIAQLAKNKGLTEKVRNTLQNFPDPADVLGNAPLIGQFFPNTKIPIVLWHGSKHPSIKKFDTRFMGSGEGAQAYGWGVYHSQSRDGSIRYQGRDHDYEDKLGKRYDKAFNGQDYVQADMYENAMLHMNPENSLRRMLDDYKDQPEIHAKIKKDHADWQDIYKDAKFGDYKVYMDDSVLGLMMNDAKAIYDQPKVVQDFLRKENGAMMDVVDAYKPLQKRREELESLIRNDFADSSERFRPTEKWEAELRDVIIEQDKLLENYQALGRGDMPHPTDGKGIYDYLVTREISANGIPKEALLSNRPESAVEKIISERLHVNGVLGRRYPRDADVSTDENFVTFNANTSSPFENKGVPIGKGLLEQLKNPLITQHNLTEEALVKHIEAGGIPMPSVAVSKVSNPLDTFGEVSLVGTSDLVKPDRWTRTYPSDMYSGRAPQDWIKYKDFDAMVEGLDPELLRWHTNTKKPETLDEIVDMNTGLNMFEDTLDMDKIKHRLEELDPGILERQMKYTQKAIDAGYDPYSYQDYRTMLHEVNKMHRRDKGVPLLEYYGNTIPESEMLGETVRKMTNPKGVLTDIGNRRRDITYSAKDALKVMRMKKAYEVGAENYTGAGLTRALTSEKFKSLEEIKANRDKIVDDDSPYITMGETEFFSDARKAANEQIVKLAKLSANAEPIGESTVYQLMDDVIITGKVSEDWGYAFKKEDISRVEDIINDLKQKGRTTETDYFESKSNRVVGMDEFKGAIVPKQMSERIEQLLRDVGINKIFRYGSEKERKELFRRFPELAFATMAVPTGGLLLSEDDNQGKVSEGLLK